MTKHCLSEASNMLTLAERIWHLILADYHARPLPGCRQHFESSTVQAGEGPQLTLELSMQKAMVDGITFTPALFYAQGPDRSHLSLCCRSEWHF